jgi:hypothetical protein
MRGLPGMTNRSYPSWVAPFLGASLGTLFMMKAAGRARRRGIVLRGHLPFELAAP